MTTLELKYSIHQSVDKIEDESLLKTILSIVTGALNSNVAGSLNGKTITTLEILQKCFEAEEDIKAGRTSSVDEIKEKIKSGFGQK